MVDCMTELAYLYIAGKLVPPIHVTLVLTLQYPLKLVLLSPGVSEWCHTHKTTKHMKY